MNLALWNELSKEQQDELQRAFDDAAIYQRKLAQETEEQQLEKVLSEGADIVVSYIDDLSPFRAAVSGVYDKYRNTDLKPYIDAVESAKSKFSK